MTGGKNHSCTEKEVGRGEGGKAEEERGEGGRDTERNRGREKFKYIPSFRVSFKVKI